MNFCKLSVKNNPICSYSNGVKSESIILLVVLSPAVNGNRNSTASVIVEKYKVGKVIGDGNFAVVKECVER